MPPAFEMPWRKEDWRAGHYAIRCQLVEHFHGCGLSNRLSNALAEAGHDIRSALSMSDSEFLRIPNLGKVSLREWQKKQIDSAEWSGKIELRGLREKYNGRDPLEAFSNGQLLEELARRLGLKVGQ